MSHIGDVVTLFGIKKCTTTMHEMHFRKAPKVAAIGPSVNKEY